MEEELAKLMLELFVEHELPIESRTKNMSARWFAKRLLAAGYAKRSDIEREIGEKLAEPMALFVNLKAGRIPMLSEDQVLDLYPALAKRSDTIEECAKVCDEVFDSVGQPIPVGGYDDGYTEGADDCRIALRNLKDKP